MLNHRALTWLEMGGKDWSAALEEGNAIDREPMVRINSIQVRPEFHEYRHGPMFI
jgi:hypothetical protein